MNTKTLRERLRDINVKILELAKLLQISRPTLYRLINLYEKKDLENIDTQYILLFNFIMEHEFINSFSVQEYINIHITSLKNGEYSNANNKDKEAFINILLQSDFYDSLFSYFVSCYKISTQETLSQENKAYLVPLQRLYENLGLELDFKIRKDKL